MENNNRKSIEEMEKEVNVFNENMKPINDWLREEGASRIYIARNSEDYDNDICPICGKEIPDRESCNGSPLVEACVCGDCDKRYVFPFRMRTRYLLDQEIEREATKQYQICLNAELMIEFSKKIKSLSADHTDVA